MADTQTPPIEEKDIQPESLELVLANVENKEGIIKMIGENNLPSLRAAKKQITSFKRRFSADKLQPKGVDDKAGIEKLKDARREMRKTRTALEDERTAIVEPHNDFVKKINGVYKPLVEEMKTIEAAAKKVDDDMDEAIEKEKQRVAREEEERINSRVDTLIKSGCVFDNGYYCAGSEEFQIPVVSVGIADLKAMSNELFEKILSEVKEKVDAVNLAIAEKKQREEEAELKRKEEERLAQEQFEREQAEFKRKQELFEKEQAEFKRQQDELAEQKRKLQEAQEKEEQRKKEQEKQRVDSIIKARGMQLLDLGLAYNGNTNSFNFHQEVFVKLSEVHDVSEEHEWQDIIDKITPVIKDRIEQIRIKEEQEKAAEQERIAAKAIEDKRLADLAEEKRKAEELALKGDKAVWEDFVSRLKAITYPETKSLEYANKVSSVKNFIDNLK